MSFEPIAIVGIGCRFPGSSDTPEAYWKMLCDGKDTVSVLPKERFNKDTFYHPKMGVEGKTYSKWGALVDHFDGFDASFFGVSPREADFIDPQQRMLLETSWRALEDGREVFDFKKGRQVGVFTGVSTFDYHLMQSGLDTSSKTDIYMATGSVHSIAANRISYVFNFKGPSVAVDTACSSALVAVHLACESLHRGDCEMALAGGVNSILGPVPYLAFCRMAMLSPTGRCRAFDSRADGFVRGEGAGMVLLKPLSQAIKDGTRIYATIAATTSNQDGRTNGITVPSPASQEALTRAAMERAGIEPSKIAYMEAHGTGTPIGDPIEAHALGMALGVGRRSDNPCPVGSVKGNIGHLEAGAGAAGIIKAALSLHHRQIPPSLHFKTVNPNIDLEKLKLRVVTEMEELPDGASQPYVGVNSFGFGGANAHAILQGVPVPQRRFRPTAAPKTDRSKASGYALAMSGGTSEAIRDIAGQFRDHLSAKPAPNVAEVCLDAATRRVQFMHRAVAVGRTRAELVEQLGLLAAGEAAPGVVEGTPMDFEHPGPVFVFSGQGPQWYAMGRDLLKHEPVFREVIERCDATMRRWGDWSLIEELSKSESKSRINETAIAQPAIFAIQAGLAALWKSWGVMPAATVGHSVGEVAAALTAGVLTLEEACRVIFWRGACMDAADDQHGRMLAASLTEEEAEELLAGYKGRVGLAAINGPKSVTLSGDAAPLEEIAVELSARQVFNRFLKVGYAFHSHHMNGARQPLLEKLGMLKLRKPSIPVYSTVSGGPAGPKTFDAGYWWHNVRKPVRFAGAIGGLIEEGYRLFLEIAPHPVLSASISECFEHKESHGTVVHSLKRRTDERLTMLAAAGRLHILGQAIDWGALYPVACGKQDFPIMPFRRVHHWHEPPRYRQIRVEDVPHPLLADRLGSAAPTWSTRLDLEVYDFLRDHVIQDHPVFPAAGYLESATAAAHEMHGDVPVRVENVDFVKALFLPENAGESTEMQFRHQPATASFEIHSRSDESSDDWTLHVKGNFRPDTMPEPSRRFDPQTMIERANREIPGYVIYRTCDFVGLRYGPTFRGISNLYHSEHESLAVIDIPPAVERSAKKFHLVPALLDCCFQAMPSSAPSDFALIRETGFMPVYCDSFRIFRPSEGRRFYCRIRIVHCGGKTLRGDMDLQDEQGRLVAEIKGLESQAVVRTKEFRATSAEECLYENGWIEAPLEAVQDGPVELPAPEWPKPEAPVTRRLRGLNRALDRIALSHLAELSMPAGISQSARRRLEDLISGANLPKSPSRSGEAFRKLLASYPDAYPEAFFVERIGSDLPAVLRGRRKVGEVLMPTGSISLEEHFSQDSPTVRHEHLALRDALRASLDAIPDHTPLEVLVLGGGSGGAVSELLACFDPECTKVVFAEPDEKRAVMAEQKFFDHHFVEYASSGLTQGKAAGVFDPQRYDLAIVLGREAEAARTEKGSRRLLRAMKSRGLCLVEGTVSPPLWAELAFGFGQESAERFLPARSESVEDLTGTLESLGFESVEAHRFGPSGRVFAAARVAAKRALREKGAFDLNVLRHRPSMVRVVFTDEGGALAPVVEELSGDLKDLVICVYRGQRFAKKGVGAYEIRPGNLQDASRLFRELDRRFSLSRLDLIFGWSLDLPAAEDLSAEALVAAQELTTAPLLAIARALPATRDELPKGMMLLTRCAQALKVGDKTLNPAGATVIGLGRTMISENSRIKVRLVDLPPAGDRREVSDLLAEIRSDSKEEEVALRSTGRRALRFLPKDLVKRSSASSRRGYRLDVLSPGMLDSMTFVEAARRTPKEGQVEISIKAAALNFRDVMKALGIYPSDSDIDMLIGDECAGVIERVGPGVKDWKVGDRVISLGAGCFGSHLTVPAPLLLPVPDGMTFEEACTLPVAFMTSVYSLVEMAKIREGETVLVQAGSGGVGMAAIQLARSLGARVIATAGNPEKREFLRRFGVEHVFDSRSLAFADQVREVTDGRGVDVVLNSLAGAAIEKGLSCLAPYGRFVEIGKRDIYGNTPVGLRPFRHNLTMSVVDLGQAMNDGGERLQTLLGEVSEHFTSGKLKPLPHRVFPMARAKDAFRCMAQARHIGKIVLSAEGSSIVPRPEAAHPTRLFRGNVAYVVTGGLTGFGREAAMWMIARGARHVYLVSRSGRADDELMQIAREAKVKGAYIHFDAVDVTSRKDVDRLVAKIKRSGMPLGGIVHSAMVLDDKTMSRMKPEQMERVLAPKVQGTWNLHEATLGEDLHCFIMFSSVSSALGNAGQGNYSAANAFLDAMAHYRKGLGLPALTVNWGQLGEVGVAAADEKLREKLTRQGIIPLPPARGLELLERLMGNGHVHTGVIPIDWKAFRATHPQLEKSSRYEEVFRHAGDDGADTGARSAREILMDAAPGARRALLTSMLKEEVAKVLRSSPSKIREDRPLTQLGLDSLMTFELLMRLESLFEISVPPTKMKEGTTLADVSMHLLETISGGQVETGSSGRAASGAATTKEGDTGLVLPDRCLIDLKKSGTREPVFMIHPAGGLVALYDGIAARLPEDRPVVALQSRVFFTEGGEFDAFEAMAAGYADAIALRQPRGDLHLFGFSFGALLAHAIARIMEERGRTVAWLGMVDPLEAVATVPEDRAEEVYRWHIDDILVLLGELYGDEVLVDTTIRDDLQDLVADLAGASAKARESRIRRWLKSRPKLAEVVDPRVIEFALSVHLHHALLAHSATLAPVKAPVSVWRGSHEWAAAVDGKPLTHGELRETVRDLGHFEFFGPDHLLTLADEVSAALVQSSS
ncbi:SDR family NAD(P)-dependent oxidoreductase [Haloferula sp. A504]|uniref:SDR family NAD(P)-dependent oxidoreductase n=1 Tax=Haloferula sp. A504 TaxID=3373601 RepID=UPI0031BF051B|nr:SDR family NAD(P)-dependent oxidoreductase [Verrucomicrobiaceae bacterium E54]